MFGLMKWGPRLPYCGTCKSLGVLYGQKTRLLLNHDIAFLSEVLLELSGVPLSGSAYRSRSCLTMPRGRDEIPVVLQYTAAVTVVLAHLRVADHRRDTPKFAGSLGWSVAARALSRPYRRAAAQLRSTDFPVEELSAILAAQPEREANPLSPADVAEPTMAATALVFSHGVRLAGRSDLCGAAGRLGSKFGELIYFLDAYEDRERDARSGAFNPPLAFPALYPDAASARKEVLAAVACLEQEMTPQHAARLRANVEERLGLRLRVIHGECRQSVRDRWRENPGVLRGAPLLGAPANGGLNLGANLMALEMFSGEASPPPIPQYPMARPDTPGANRMPGDLGGCRARIWDGCKESCAESCVEAILESICGG